MSFVTGHRNWVIRRNNWMLPKKPSISTGNCKTLTHESEERLACEKAVDELRRSIYRPSRHNTEALFRYIVKAKSQSLSTLENSTSSIFSERFRDCINELERLLIRKLESDFFKGVRTNDTILLDKLFKISLPEEIKRKIFENINLVQFGWGIQKKEALKVLFENVAYFPKDIRKDFFFRSSNSSYLHESLNYDWPDLADTILKNYKHFPEDVQDQFFSFDQKGKTAFHIAAKKYNPSIINRLLSISKKLPPNFLKSLFSPDLQKEKTLVDLAYDKGWGDVICKILDKVTYYPARVQKDLLTGANGKNPILQRAISENMFGLIHKVVSEFSSYPRHMQELILRPNRDGNTLLHQAADYGYYGLIDEILDAVPEFSKDTQKSLFAHNSSGRSPLHFLIKNSMSKHLKRSLEVIRSQSRYLHKSLFNKNPNTFNILHYAATEGNLDCFQVLLNEVNFFPEVCKEEILGRDKNGNSMLHRALAPLPLQNKKKDKLKLAHFLLEEKEALPQKTREEFYYPNEFGDTPLHFTSTSAERFFGPYRKLSRNLLKDYLRNRPALFAQSLECNALGFSPLNQPRLHKMMKKYLSRLTTEQFGEILHGLRINAKESLYSIATKEQEAAIPKEIHDLISLKRSTQLNKTHLHRGVHFESEIPKAPDVDIGELLNMYDEIDFEENEKVNADGHKVSGNDLKKSLKTFVSNIKGQVAFLGTPPVEKPKQLKAFYDQLENVVRHITHKLQGMPNAERRTYLIDLAVAGLRCGGRYVSETQTLYQLLSEDGANAVEAQAMDMQIYKKLHDHRQEIINLFMQLKYGGHAINAHTYTTFMKRVGNELGLVGSALSNYNDPFEDESINKKDVLKAFFKRYNNGSLLEFMSKYINEKVMLDGDARDILIDWFKEHAPENCSNPQEYLYEIYTEDFSGINIRAIAELLQNLEIIQEVQR